MKPEVIEVNGIRCNLRPDMITVKYSYTIDYKDISRFCEKLKVLTGSTYKRSAKSWTKEIVAHNMLLHAGFFVSHVADTDLDEHEKKYRLLCYDIMYRLHRFWEWLGEED